VTSEEIGRRIRALRILRGISTQAQLDALMAEQGLGKQSGHRTERGRLGMTPATRKMLAVVLQVPEEWFLEDLDKLLVYGITSKLDGDASLQHPEGSLGRVLSAGAPSPANRRQTRNRPGPDSRRDSD
jgi:transcriptional regulator with XRE-family HTH domain